MYVPLEAVSHCERRIDLTPKCSADAKIRTAPTLRGEIMLGG